MNKLELNLLKVITVNIENKRDLHNIRYKHTTVLHQVRPIFENFRLTLS